MTEVTVSQVTKYLIPATDRCDAICVYTEDYEPRRGKIIIECFGLSWSSFWGGMSETHKGVLGFVLYCGNDYLLGKLMPYERIYEPDFEAAINKLQKAVIEWRRNSTISAETARNLFDNSNHVSSIDDVREWVFDLENEVNNNYLLDDWYDLIPEKLTSEAHRLLNHILPRIKEMLAPFSPAPSGVQQ